MNVDTNNVIDLSAEGENPEVPTAGTPDTNGQPTQFVPREIFKQLKKQHAHIQRQNKKRQERRSQPYADAKIEDLDFVFNQCLTEIEILRRTLLMAGLITKEGVQAARDFQEKRVAKAQELAQDTTMSLEDKKKAAAEYDIPLRAIGIEETEPQAETPAETQTSETPQVDGQ